MLGTLALFLSMYVWEYTAIRRNLEFSPSVALTSMATYAVRFWEACGKIVAWVSSFLTLFDFDDLLKAAEQLWKPIWDTLTSWTYFFIGYVSEMNLYDHSYLITMGSIMIVSLLCYIAYYFGLFQYLEPFKQYIPDFSVSDDQSPYYSDCVDTAKSPRGKRNN